MYEGAPDYPHKGIWWELCERYGVTIFYTAPTAIRACMKWGAEHVETPRPVASCGCSGRSASRSTRRRGSGTTRSSAASAARSSTRGGRPRPARIMITTLPGRAARPSPGSPARRCRASTPRSLDEDGDEVDRRHAGPARAAHAVAGDAAHALPRRRPLRRDLLVASGASETYLVGDAATQDEDGYFWVIGRVDDVHQRLRPPHVDRRDRVGDRLAPEGRRGRGHRPGRRGHRPVRSPRS